MTKTVGPLLNNQEWVQTLPVSQPQTNGNRNRNDHIIRRGHGWHSICCGNDMFVHCTHLLSCCTELRSLSKLITRKLHIFRSQFDRSGLRNFAHRRRQKQVFIGRFIISSQPVSVVPPGLPVSTQQNFWFSCRHPLTRKTQGMLVLVPLLSHGVWPYYV